MRRILAVLTSAALAGAASAAEPAELVAKLGAAKFADREAAGKELLRAGAAALPALKTAVATTSDAEVRERAAALIDTIGKQSESAKLLAVKPVTLSHTNKSLAAVVANIKEQTGIPLTLVAGKVADPARPITLTSPTPVAPWEAVALLCRAAGLREDFPAEYSPPQQSTSNYRYRRYYDDGSQPQVHAGQVPIFLCDGPPDALSGTRTGGVRVLALPGRFPTNKVIRGAGRVELTLDVTPLPGLNWTDVSCVRVTKAEDESGRPLFADLKPMVDSPYYGTGYGGFWGQQMFWDDYGNGNTIKPQANPRLVPVSLRTDDRGVKILRKLEGVVVGEISQQNVPIITIHDIAVASKRTDPFVGPNDVKLSVSGFTTTAKGTHTCHIRIEAWQEHILRLMKKGAANPMNGMVFWGGWSSSDGNFLQNISIYDAAGNELPKPQPRTTSMSSDGYKTTTDAEVEFAKHPKFGPPVKLILRGTKPVTAEVPFTAANVKLP